MIIPAKICRCDMELLIWNCIENETFSFILQNHQVDKIAITIKKTTVARLMWNRRIITYINSQPANPLVKYKSCSFSRYSYCQINNIFIIFSDDIIKFVYSVDVREIFCHCFMYAVSIQVHTHANTRTHTRDHSSHFKLFDV